MAKLEKEDVEEMRRRYKNGEKQKEIAADFRLSQGTVSRIVRNRRWSHL